MNGADLLLHKKTLRTEYKTLRESVPLNARRDVAQKLLEQFKSLKGPLLSFASFADEIDLWPLNRYFAEQKSLILPHFKSQSLYRIENIDSQLILSDINILEPDPSHAEKIDPQEIATALIPGLAFDAHLFRLGYGKGFYDRLIPRLTNAHTIGIGFTIQYSETKLPIEAHDEPLDELALF